MLMTEKAPLYTNLKGLREDHDLSQTDMAKMLNCSQVSYSYYELGRRDIPTDVLIKLADFFDCSIDYLLGQTGKKARNQ